MTTDRYRTLGLKPLTRFLLTCSGATPAVVVRCPTEREKLVGLGSAVLISATLATISGTVAFATIAGGGADLPQWIAVTAPLGLAYGLAIFALDRFLVATPLAGAVDPDHGRPRRPWDLIQVLAAGAPRLVLSVIIGVLVAEPLLLVAFRQEIDQRITQTQAEVLSQRITDIEDEALARLVALDEREADLTAIDPALSDALVELHDLDREIEVATEQLASLQVELRSEVDGVQLDTATGRTTGESGDGPAADAIRAQIDLQQIALATLTDRRPGLQSRVDGLQAAQDARLDVNQAELDAVAADRAQIATQRSLDIAAAQEGAQHRPGLLSRVEALEWLTRHQPDDRNQDPRTGSVFGLTTIGLTVWLVRLWLIVLDAMPIVFKMLLSIRRHRPYDCLHTALQRAEIALAADLAITVPRPIGLRSEPARTNRPSRGVRGVSLTSGQLRPMTPTIVPPDLSQSADVTESINRVAPAAGANMPGRTAAGTTSRSGR